MLGVWQHTGNYFSFHLFDMIAFFQLWQTITKGAERFRNSRDIVNFGGLYEKIKQKNKLENWKVIYLSPLLWTYLAQYHIEIEVEWSKEIVNLKCDALIDKSGKEIQRKNSPLLGVHGVEWNHQRIGNAKDVFRWDLKHFHLSRI